METELHSVKDFEREIGMRKGYAILDFWATWCPPCRMMAPVFKAASERLPHIHFCKVDSDEVQELASSFDVMSIPTLIVFKDGQEVHRLSGYRPLDVFTDELKTLTGV